jgi:hypothetical protein
MTNNLGKQKPLLGLQSGAAIKRWLANAKTLKASTNVANVPTQHVGHLNRRMGRSVS